MSDATREARRARWAALQLRPDEARRVVAVALLSVATVLPTALRHFTEGEAPLGRPSPSCADEARRAADGAVVCGPDGAPLAPAARLMMGVPLDVDAASAEGLTLVSGIGPRLAARIVEDRATRGPFGGAAGLERVRGIGPKLAARAAALERRRPPPGP
jgi:predicted flap endonuclease-1-like 5' DNA nuclease